jgi:hypothetical protein
LDKLAEHNKLIVDALKAELTPEDYRKVADRLRKSGVAI